MLESGGAKITDKDDFTHVFVTKRYSGEIEEKDYHTTDYIFSYLFKARG
jgi:hypothetical protein